MRAPLSGSFARVPLAFTLAEVALRVDRTPTRGPVGPGLDRIASHIAELPEALRERVEELELSRLDRSVTYLEEWWAHLCDDELGVEERLERIVRSKFFDAIWDEGALTRTALEVGLVADLLPEATTACEGLRKRLEALEERTRRAARALLQQRTDAAWAAAVS